VDESTKSTAEEVESEAGGWWRRLVRWLPGAVLVVPGIWQVWLMCRAWWGRFFYPYDLEWMEGGMLVHAWRLLRGETIYPPPSLEFVPYLYTPLYSVVVAVSSAVTGVSYQIGRAVSLCSMVVVIALVVVAVRFEFDDERPGHRWVGWVAAVLGVGMVAAGYPWTDGWYDIARPDSLLCAVGLAGFVGLRRELQTSPVQGSGEESTETERVAGGWRSFWDPAVAGWGVLLALSFFIKQTGLLFVAGAGVIVLVSRWRSVPSFVAAAGVTGLGGTWLINLATGGWFWRYIFVYHQRHANSYDRFVSAWGSMWSQRPVVFVVVGGACGLALIAYGLSGLGRWSGGWLGGWRRAVEGDRALSGTVYWGWLAGVGALFGATGFATQWAETNAYMPFIIFGAVAVGAAIAGTMRLLELVDAPGETPFVAATIVLTVASGGLASASWSPAAHIPAESQREAGDALVERFEAIEGRIFAPYFPWYVRLAGKQPHMHIMARNDVIRLTPRRCPTDEPAGERPWICPELPSEGKQIDGWTEGLTAERFEAIVMPPTSGVIPKLGDFQLGEQLGRGQVPSPPTGYEFGGMAIMRTEQPRALASDAEMVFDFESDLGPGWEIEGTAWGDGPVSSTLPQQLPVGGYGGDRFMNSYHGGDRSTGTVRSPEFRITRPSMHLWVGGGRLDDGVRVELRVGGEVVRQAAGKRRERMHEVVWDLGGHLGETARLKFVDESSGGWGHVTVDDIWLQGEVARGAGDSPREGESNDDDG